MSAGRLILWRHGRTAANAGFRLQGQIDIPLDEVGRWQARTAAASLVARHEPTHIVSSDLSRARATAEHLARTAGLEVTVDPQIRERSFGVWEGLTGDEIAAKWPDEFRAWREADVPPGIGGESRAEVASRMGAAVRAHADALGEQDTLVVVSHGAAIALAVGELLEQPPEWRGFVGLLNGHWAELVPAHGAVRPRWRLIAFNSGPTDASRDWNAGPDALSEEDVETRDPD